MPMFFSPEDLPPEIREQVMGQIDLHNMQNNAIRHDFKNLLHSLDESGLVALANFIHNVGNHQSQFGAFWEGVINQILDDKFDTCIVCDVKHSEELADLVGNSDGPHVHFDETADSVQRTPADITKDGVGNDLTETPIAKAWPDVIKDLPKSFIAKLDEFHLNLITNEYPRVMCARCGLQYPSLEDRMKKPEDECQGCQQKAKFG